MLQNRKILITGATGMVGMPIVRYLAPNNDVWAAARFADASARAQVEEAGALPVSLDLGAADLAALANDFDYVLHLAYYRGGDADFDRAIKINAEGLGLVLKHCRRAKAALVMSSSGIYSATSDPYRIALESDPIGGNVTPWAPTASAAKVAQEAVARFCARAFDLPVTIARLNTIYGNVDRMLPISQMDAVMQDREVVLRSDPNMHAPIHINDVCRQIEPMLRAASVPATIVNWAGDEQVSAQQWCQLVADWSGKEARIRVQPVPGSAAGLLADTARRQSITGPCQQRFVESYRAVFDERYPEYSRRR